VWEAMGLVANYGSDSDAGSSSESEPEEPAPAPAPKPAPKPAPASGAAGGSLFASLPAAKKKRVIQFRTPINTDALLAADEVRVPFKEILRKSLAMLCGQLPVPSCLCS
jgi:hypothetical protein